jgi:hypothetical protein
MENELEKYLKKQRASLDVESPDDQLIWEGIRQDIRPSGIRRNRKRTLFRIRNVAAALILLVSVGYMVQDILWDRGIRRDFSLADMDRELGAREKEYRGLVSFKEKEVRSLNHVDHMIISELLEEIRRLDTIYAESMKDLQELGYNEQVIQTIFDTYEKKIYLLELIILENNKIKIHETEQHLFL